MRALHAVFIGAIYLITVLLLSFIYRRGRRDLLILIELACFAAISFVLLGVFLLIILAQIELGRAVAGNVTPEPATPTAPAIALATPAAPQAPTAPPTSPTFTAAPSATPTPTVTLPHASPTRPQPSATAAPTDAPATPAPEPTPTPVPPPADPPAPVAEAPPAPAEITTTVSFVGGLVRSSPGIGDNVVGTVYQGDDLIVLGASDDWYLVRLGQTRSERSNIGGDQGWISRDLVNPPSQPPPLITP